MNAETMKELRLKMLKGEWSKYCTRCFEVEKNGGSSRRMIENAAHKELIPDLISSTAPDGTIPVAFKSIDYRLGNKCNLQCRMCNPLSTERWIKDWNEVKTKNEQMSAELLSQCSTFTWPEDDCLTEEFRGKLKGVERIHFAGGEPLISPQMTKILKECISLGYSQQITISYNTNITILPKEVTELWKHFKEIKLLCSVDGYGVVNDYIRYPSRWDQIDRNLQFLDDNAAAFNISEILLSCTVQIYNVLYLNELFDYVKKFKKIDPIINLINLHYPEYLSTQALPLPAKEIATARLKKILEDLEQRHISHEFHISNIYQAISYMNEADKTVNLISFKKFNATFDKKKNMKLSSSLKELNAHLMQFYVNNLPTFIRQ